MVEHKKILVEVNTPIRTIFLLPSWSVWAESTTRPPPLSPYTYMPQNTQKREVYSWRSCTRQGCLEGSAEAIAKNLCGWHAILVWLRGKKALRWVNRLSQAGTAVTKLCG